MNNGVLDGVRSSPGGALALRFFVRAESSFAAVGRARAACESRASRACAAREPHTPHRRRRDRDYVVKTLARKLIMKSKGVSL